MECFKNKSSYKFNSKLITLFICTLSASSFATENIKNQAIPNELFLSSLHKTINFDWSGAHLGGYIGGAWGNSNLSTTAGKLSNYSYFASNETINAVSLNGSQTLIPSVFIGGVQFGDSWMFKNYLYGFILDFGSLNLKDSHVVQNSSYPDGSGSYSIATSFNTDWMYTFRGRIGWEPNLAWPVMLYGTGGLAVTQLSVSTQFSDTNTLQGIGSSNNRSTLNGWTVGLGLEFPIAHNLTINSEYLYANFGSVTTKSSVYNSTAGFGIDYQSLVSPLITTAPLYSNFFKVGINYKFNTDITMNNQK